MTIRALREDEFDEHAELVYRSYTHEREIPADSMLTHRDWWVRSIERDPCYEPEQTRVMEVDGRLVASVTCYYRPTYIAGRQVEASCIGSVCTHPDYRRRGYVREILTECVEWMTARRWEWSFLYGKAEVYGGSGWLNLASLDLSTDLQLRDDAPSDFTERHADPDSDADIALLTRLHERFNADLTGPTVRTEAYWRSRVLSSRPWGRGPTYTIVEGADGAALGYYYRGGSEVREVAWADRPHEVLKAILRGADEGPINFRCLVPGLIEGLRELAAIPEQKQCLDGAGGIRMRQAYRGLWRLNPVPDPVVDVADTAALLRLLHDAGYVMWPADGA
ncbi:MAG: GNAT family N-acetyltransferase [candidate division WS1 bacterium]|jgi:predicted N-acetyltransferase YhbS|nr:GNAT family N-acetyltransferase [candidate division WS1 bacterium]